MKAQGQQGTRSPNGWDRWTLRVSPRNQTTIGGLKEAQEDEVAQLATGQGWGKAREAPLAAATRERPRPEVAQGRARPAGSSGRQRAQSRTARSAGPRLAAPAPPGSLLKMQSLRPHLGQKNQNLPCNKGPRDLCAFKFRT